MQHIDRNRLRSSIRKESDSMIFKRGELYFRQGRASSPLYKVGDKSSLDVEGVVRGSKTYKVRITIDESDSSIADYSCNCPYEYGMCKHVVALGLSVVDTLEDNPSYFEDTKSLQVSQDGDSHPMDTQTQTVLQKLKELGIDGSLLSQDLVQKIVEAIKTTASKDSQDKKSGRHPIEEYTPQMTKSGRIHMVRVTGEEQRKKVEPKPKPIKLFSERYYISLGSSYRGRVQSVQLYGIQSKSSWRYSLQEISASGLLTSKETFTSEQIDFLIQLNEWKKQEHHMKM